MNILTNIIESAKNKKYNYFCNTHAHWNIFIFLNNARIIFPASLKLFWCIKHDTKHDKITKRAFQNSEESFDETAGPNIPSSSKGINGETMAAGLMGNLNNPENSRVNGNDC